MKECLPVIEPAKINASEVTKRGLENVQYNAPAHSGQTHSSIV